MSKVLKNITSIMIGAVATATYPGTGGWVGTKLGTITGDGVTIAEGEPKIENLKVAGQSIPIDQNVEAGEPITFTGACYVEVGAELTNIKGGTLGADGWEAGSEVYIVNKAFVLATKDANMKVLIPNGSMVGWFTGKLADNGSALINFKITPMDAGATLDPFKITKA